MNDIQTYLDERAADRRDMAVAIGLGIMLLAVLVAWWLH